MTNKFPCESLIDASNPEYWWAASKAEPFIFHFMQQDGSVKITAKELHDLLVTMFYIGKED